MINNRVSISFVYVITESKILYPICITGDFWFIYTNHIKKSDKNLVHYMLI